VPGTIELTEARHRCRTALAPFVEWSMRCTGFATPEGAVMTEYLLYFNQQWVGDHSEEWFRGRGLLAKAAVDEMKAAGVYVFAGGLEEDGPVYNAVPTGKDVLVADGPYAETKEWLGGFTVVDVADDEAAKVWAGRIAEACGWPQEVRRFGRQPQAE